VVVRDLAARPAKMVLIRKKYIRSAYAEGISVHGAICTAWLVDMRDFCTPVDFSMGQGDRESSGYCFAVVAF
jgi:hypothetical protein